MMSNRALAIHLLLFPAIGANLVILAEATIAVDRPHTFLESVITALPLVLPSILAAIPAARHRAYGRLVLWPIVAAAMTFGFMIFEVLAFFFLNDTPPAAPTTGSSADPPSGSLH
jgi:F0F1-type ATP synthase assembly protein I